MNIQEEMQALAQRASLASRKMRSISPKAKIDFLQILSDLIIERTSKILEINSKDIEKAKKDGLDAPRIDRLTLTEKILKEMAAACLHVAQLPDPIGATVEQWQRPNGLLVGKMRVPLGVIAMIYEARPNVTIDAAILCLKAGNAVILRGGREAFNSNVYLADLLRESLEKAGIPMDAVQLVTNLDHLAVTELCKLDKYIDVMIPRGGESLVRAVTEASTMPVLKHFMGVCHVYVDEEADLSIATNIIYNGKVQRPGVCNALECILVHSKCIDKLLPEIAKKLGEAGVEFRACERSLPLLGKYAVAQKPEDLGMEFHDLILAVKVVDNMDEALDHIAKYGSNHTDVICTNNHAKAMRFLREVDASMVGVNASTRFNDGGQLGLGAEIGISTSKIHAYGPMGVTELTGTKFVVFGQGQVRE